MLAFRPRRQSPAAYASVAAVAAAPLRAVASSFLVARSRAPACVLALPRVAPSLAPLRSPASLRSSQSLRRRRRHCRPCKPPCIPDPPPEPSPATAPPPARSTPHIPSKTPLMCVKKKIKKSRFGSSYEPIHAGNSYICGRVTITSKPMSKSTAFYRAFLLKQQPVPPVPATESEGSKKTKKS